jgi:hypothetical protein
MQPGHAHDANGGDHAIYSHLRGPTSTSFFPPAKSNLPRASRWSVTNLELERDVDLKQGEEYLCRV